MGDVALSDPYCTQTAELNDCGYATGARSARVRQAARVGAGEGTWSELGQGWLDEGLWPQQVTLPPKV